jgi:hypothetical protein
MSREPVGIITVVDIVPGPATSDQAPGPKPDMEKAPAASVIAGTQRNPLHAWTVLLETGRPAVSTRRPLS